MARIHQILSFFFAGALALLLAEYLTDDIWLQLALALGIGGLLGYVFYRLLNY